MADIQKQFEQFHQNIRIDYDMGQPLREKRDIILNRIRKYLKDKGLPSVDELLQGSYAIKTGVIPIEELEYDIDVGLRFYFDENSYTAKEVRKWIFDAVNGHTDKVDSKGPCVRVTYTKGYHVDLVCYAIWEDSAKKVQFRLAHKENGWRPSDPPGLLNYVNTAMEKYEGTEDAATSTNQFRRIIRYLRRWYDEAICKDSKAKPVGIAYVLAAVHYLQPTYNWQGKPDDLEALKNFADTLSAIPDRITAYKPTPEYDDVFAKLSNDEMDDFKTRLKDLSQGLDEAHNEVDPVEACRIVKKYLGRDFPIPEPEETGKKTSAPAIVTSSSSAS